MTPNQIVAYNLRLARMLRGWTQDEAAERLEPQLGARWSRVVFSAAERSTEGRRIRQFSADDLVAFAEVFDVPISFFFRPPPEVDRIAVSDAAEGITPERLTDLARRPDDDERVAALVQQARERETAKIERLFSSPEWSRPALPPTKRKDKR